jgi:subtilisin family serine protease
MVDIARCRRATVCDRPRRLDVSQNTDDDMARATDALEAARERLKQRLVPEVQTALEADKAKEVRAWPRDWESRGIDYFYRSSSVLTRDADVPRVREALSGLGAMPDDDSEQPADESSPNLINGITRLMMRVPDSKHTPDVVKDLDERLGVGVATHDHVFVVTRYGTVCPASEPEPVMTPQQAQNPVAVEAALWPPRADAAGGQNVRVSVVDTGLLQGAAAWAPWIEGVRPGSRADVEDPDRLKVDGQKRGRDGYADPYAGHGTFVSGIVRCVAPAAEVTVERVLGVSGFVQESSMVTQLHDALSRSPDIITMSAGGYTRGNVPPLSFQTLYEQRLSQLGGVVLVAAAGNDAQSDPFWPAAFPWCVGVGSMSRDGQHRSFFSNYGAWVDVYAPGEEIINAYPRLPYKTAEKAIVRDTSAGIVSWSGTSFSTPIVSGLIAARMSRTGENAREAASALLGAARGQFRPGIGPRLFP